MRSCCFTVNGVNGERKGFEWTEAVRYAVWQLERGGGGREHVQGYIEFDRPMSVGGIKKILGSTAHVEGRRGSREEAREYSRKEASRVEGPWEYGRWIGGRGHRSDIEVVLGALKEGKSEERIMEEFPREWGRNYRLIDRYRMIKGSKRQFKSEFHLYLGDSGTGKTRTVYKLSPEGYWKSPGPWYDGYDGEQDLILDEIDKQGISLGELLRIVDRYPARLAVKGGHVGCTPKRVYGTSNLGIEEWYKGIKAEEVAALKRRVTTITTYRWVEGEGEGERRRIKVIKEVMDDKGKVKTREMEERTVEESEGDSEVEVVKKPRRVSL